MAGETTSLSTLLFTTGASREFYELARFDWQGYAEVIDPDQPLANVQHLRLDDAAALEISMRLGRYVGFNRCPATREFQLEQRCGACHRPITVRLAESLIGELVSFDLAGVAVLLQRIYFEHRCPPRYFERQLERLTGPELEAMAVKAERDMLRAGELLDLLRKRGAF